MIAEMVTGEGKTLVSTLAAYLNALLGRGVHVVTTNDFLARRDAAWMKPAYEFLGMSVGAIQSEMETAERQAEYACEITYGTNNEFGFDYLRDNMRESRENQVQRELFYGIIDECDNVLIDEARTPLIISGPAEESTEKYYLANKVALRLVPGVHYEVKEKERRATLTEDGILAAQEQLGVDSLYTGRNVDWPHHLSQALAAKELHRRDREYVVQGGEIVIVDEFTGRLMPGRRWSDGLHQAIEAKERLRIKEENQTLATITFQNYFRLYDKLAGMTGTALTEAGEFDKIYKLDVLPLPTNRPLRRVSFPDLIHGTQKEKVDAIVEEIVAVHQEGRPVLVGTTSIEKSEQLSRHLQRLGLDHQVLNAKHHEREAAIIAQAGQRGAVTIATNMAGRGTDIVLGDGVVQCRACCVTCDEQCDICPNAEKHPECFRREEVHCGLHVIGTERHEARRIDNQLRGRSGRQGDPGSSRFFLSLEDDLMRIFMGDWVRGFMQRQGMAGGEPIESRMASRAIERAQKRVEEINFEARKRVLEYDEVMNEQRKLVYGQRQRILEGMCLVSPDDFIDDLLSRCIDEPWRQARAAELVPQRNFTVFADWLQGFGLKLELDEWLQAGEPELMGLLAERAKQAGEPREESVRRWLDGLAERSVEPGAYWTTWRLDDLALELKRVRVTLDPAAVRQALQRAINQVVAETASQAWEQTDRAALAERWVRAGLDEDLPPRRHPKRLEFDPVRQWADRHGLPLSSKEFDPLGGKRDPVEALLREKAQEKLTSLSADAAAAQFAVPAAAAYGEATATDRQMSSARWSFWARRRLGLELPAEALDAAIRSVWDDLLAELTKATLARLEPIGEDQASERWIRFLLDAFWRRDFSAEDRDLSRFANTIEAAWKVWLSPFDLWKKTSEEIRVTALERLGPEAERVMSGGQLEDIAQQMIESAAVASVSRYVESGVAARLPDLCYEGFSAWAGAFRLQVGRDEWEELPLDELRVAVVAAARAAYAGVGKADLIARFLPSALQAYLESAPFQESNSYSALAKWADRQRIFQPHDRKLDAELNALGRQLREQAHRDLAEPLAEGYGAAGRSKEETIDRVMDQAIEAFSATEASGGEGVDPELLVAWVAKAFKCSISAGKLSRFIEGEEEGPLQQEGRLEGLIQESARRAYQRQPVEKLVADLVQAVLDLHADVEAFPGSWDLDAVQQWAERSSIPLIFSAGIYRDEFEKSLAGFFVSLAEVMCKDVGPEEVLEELVFDALDSFLVVDLATPGRDLAALADRVNRKFGLDVTALELAKWRGQKLEQELVERGRRGYAERKAAVGAGPMLWSVRGLLLHTIDLKWKDHLYAMDHLESGIGLRGYAGVDPKIAYKKEGYTMFERMIASIEEDVTDLLLKVKLDEDEGAGSTWTVSDYIHEEAGQFQPPKAEEPAAVAATAARPRPAQAVKEPGRNDPCPCGRTRSDGTPVKYKNCCMKKANA